MEKSLTPADLSLAGWRQHSLDGFIQLAGPLWSKREEDEWKYGFLTEARHANPARVVHGGLLTTLMDHALSTIAWEAAGRLPCVTIQLDTHFISAVQPGSFVVARGRITRRSATLVFMQGVLSVEKDEVVTASAILKIIKRG
jgi:acyl-coenzyme A thioesterase PaaI-like protein